MKILFTHGYYILEDEKEQEIMRPYPPLGILYLSAYLEQNGFDNDVYDTTFETKAKFREAILQKPPNILAIYVNLMTKLNVIEMIKYVRTKPELKGTKIVLGGPDVRHNVADYIGTGADICVIGEGEQTMLEIVQTWSEGDFSDFAHIDGVAYLNEANEVIQTKERSRIRPVDDLPLPNRQKIDMRAYMKVWKDYHGQSAMTMSTQRGCPYTCKWCSTAVYGQSYRRRSPALVAAELKAIKTEYNPDTIWFVDDVFTVSKKWLEGFKDEVIAQDAVIPFECITRADRMNEEVIKWLKEAGCFRIWIGAESGSQKVIDLMDRRVDVMYVRDMIRMTRQQGVEAGTFIMLGYPGETITDIKETIIHLKDSNPHYFTITVAYPIKGTSLYQEVESKQLAALNWQETTDRDRDFERSYTRAFYDHAVRWVDNEVRWHQAKISGNWYKPSAIKHKIKSIISYRRAMMIS